jgi:hypothetical protein
LKEILRQIEMRHRKRQAAKIPLIEIELPPAGSGAWREQ